jgi:hypothetical protein
MNFFLTYFLFVLLNKQLKKYNNLKLSLKDDNNNTKKAKIHISKKYILDTINEYSDSYNKSNTEFKSILSGVNYAYPYEDNNKNNKILNNIHNNLFLKEQNNLLNDKKILNHTKLKIACEYLSMNTTKYKININNGGLFNEWLFNF